MTTNEFEPNFAALDVAPAASAQMIAWYAPKTFAAIERYFTTRMVPDVAAQAEVLAEMAAEAAAEVDY